MGVEIRREVMRNVNEVFKRYEKKYMLMIEQYGALMQELQVYMQQDDYGQHTICNIYYDTPDYELIRTSIEKPVYKEKFRVRSYGVPGVEDLVFLELKKKYKGVVYKRRVPLSYKQAMEYLIEKKKPQEQTQIMKEIDWFMKMEQPVPKVFIAYDRIALFGKEDANLRVTFDTNIRFREENLNLANGDYGTPLMKENQVLMEIKIPGTMPLWMAHLLTKLEIYPTSYSKYGTCYMTNLYKEELFLGKIASAEWKEGKQKIVAEQNGGINYA